jgi:uncharacterized protein
MTRFADTGFWYGLHVAADRRHEPAVALWRGDRRAVVTTDLVVGETWTLARMRGVSHARAVGLVDAIHASSRIEVVTVDKGVRQEAWAWLRRHDERIYSFVDATSFAVMRRRRLHEALSFDGDFTAAGFIEVRP